jgi:hypothetical protein
MEFFPPDEQPEQKPRFLPGAIRNGEGVSHVRGGGTGMVAYGNTHSSCSKLRGSFCA